MARWLKTHMSTKRALIADGNSLRTKAKIDIFAKKLKTLDQNPTIKDCMKNLNLYFSKLQKSSFQQATRASR
jgi:hypothetical protein